jgi:hypothetical protein
MGRVQKLPSERSVSAGELPEKTPLVSPESAQTATADRCASSKETADARYSRQDAAGASGDTAAHMSVSEAACRREYRPAIRRPYSPFSATAR